MKGVQERLDEWCEWLHERNYALVPKSMSVMQRMAEDRENAGAHGSGFAYTMVDDVPCRPDGGLAAFIVRAEGAIRWEARCREVQDAYDEMPADMREIVQARYVGGWRETPRSFGRCAELLANEEGPPIAPTTVFDRHKRMLQWLDEKLKIKFRKVA